jgi:hypothetical protein
MHESDVIPTLLTACPSFKPHWDDYISDEIYIPNQVYVDLHEFAHHLLRLLQACTVEEFGNVFAAVECLIEEGDDEARDAVTIGLLESLYFEAEFAGIPPRKWLEFFGPKAQVYWQNYFNLGKEK